MVKKIKGFQKSEILDYLRKIEDINEKINLAYRLRDYGKIKLFLAETFVYDDTGNRKPNLEQEKIATDFRYLTALHFDTLYIFEPVLELSIYIVENDKDINKLMFNSKKFER